MKKTTNQVVTAGTGAALTKGQTITFDYVLVDGRSGKELETSFGNTPGSLTLDPSKTATQLVTSLTGKTVGSRLLVAIAPKDGLAKRLNNPAVKKTDTLLFVIDVKNVRTPLARATGAPVAPVAGLPTVTLAANGKPTITVPAGAAAPTQLVTQALIKGAGPAVTAGQTITVQYTSVKWDGKLFDSTWDRGAADRHPHRHRHRDPRVGRGPRRADGRVAGAARRPARQGLRHLGEQRRKGQGHRHARVRDRHPRRVLIHTRLSTRPASARW